MKKFFFGAAVVAIALSASAFTSANVAIGDYIVQTTADSYTLELEANYDESHCTTQSQKPCAYKQVASPIIGTFPLDQSEINANLSATPARIAVETGNGIYSN